MSVPPENPSRPRLLVVDDDPDVRQVLLRLGRAVGFEVVGSDGGTDLDAQLHGAADLITLDLVMPVMDGVEIIERLARVHSAARIVLVSGQDRRVL
ncbi:MAG: response regulator transcription factor, partial [Steroidobacteraceae bacterium]